MPRDFDQLLVEIEQEALAEGPRAVRELERFREEFGLASQLVASRKERRLSQRELAKLSGVPQSEISRIETGAANPTYATVTALLRPLGKRIQLVADGGAAARPGARGATRPKAKAPSRASSGRRSSAATSTRRARTAA